MQRRQFVKIMNSVLALSAVEFSSLASFAAGNEVSLKRAGAKVGLKIGSDSDIAFMKAPEAYRQLFLKQCNLFACMFGWKLAFKTEYDSSPQWEDPNIRFAINNNLQLTGGHLLWHGSSPAWLLNSNRIQEKASNFIQLVADKYKSNLFSWNVVNEALNPKEGRPDGLRHTVFLNKMGTSYFDFAFREAQKYAPNVMRVYNDYALEMATPDQEAKRTALLKLLDKFKADGTPIDAVGLQSHLTLDGQSRFDEKVYRNFLSEISSRGLKILITELDVFDKVTPSADFKERDQQVADLYKSFLSTALDERAVKAVTLWGLCDKYTWLSPRSNRTFARMDALPSRPLPFDDSLRQKPAYYAVLNALQNAPTRGA